RPVRRWPGKVALVDDRGTLSFTEVDEQARRLARALTEAGARPGDRAAVILPNGMPFIVTEAAILRAGLVKVPLNIRFHVNEVMYSLADSEPTILICDRIYSDAVLSRRSELPGLAAIFVVGAQNPDCKSYDEAVAGGEPWRSAYSYQDDDPVL